MEILTVEEVAEKTNKSVKTIRRQIAEGSLKATKINERKRSNTNGIFTGLMDLLYVVVLVVAIMITKNGEDALPYLIFFSFLNYHIGQIIRPPLFGFLGDFLGRLDNLFQKFFISKNLF